MIKHTTLHFVTYYVLKNIYPLENYFHQDLLFKNYGSKQLRIFSFWKTVFDVRNKVYKEVKVLRFLCLILKKKKVVLFVF